jgi:hypothetical protein
MWKLVAERGVGTCRSGECCRTEREEASFARRSASLFCGRVVWPGIHTMVTDIPASRRSVLVLVIEFLVVQ